MLEKLWSNLHQSYFVVFWCIGVIVGVVLGLVFRINYFSSPWWCALAILLFLAAYLKPKMVFITIALMAGMFVAFFKVSEELAGVQYIQQFYGQTIIVKGTVDGDPEIDEGTIKFKLKDLCFGENGEYEVRGSLYVSGNKSVEVARGDLVTLEGKLSEGFGVYAGYLYKPKVLHWARPEPGDVVLRVRNWFAERVRKLIPDPEENLGLSYLLGMKAGLPDELSENLRAVGLTHIVVASGAHLAILVEIAKKIFGRVSRFAGLLFSGLFVVFFMAMVGWTPSILRAGIMAILTLMTWYVGRKIAPWRMILLVVAVTLLMNPVFVINLGWLLSFASFGGIMILGPKMTKIFYGEKRTGFIAETVITTMAATIMTLPITLYYYGQISLISVVANLLILPTLAYAMGLVFLAGVFAGLPGVEVVLGFVATKLLDFHILVVEFFGQMTQFLVKVEPYQPQIFLIYGGIAIGLLLRKMVKLREVS